MDIGNLDLDYSHAGNDVRHKLAMNVIAEIPFRSGSALLNGILGGWQVNAISIMQTGTPFTVTCTLAAPNCDFNRDGANNDRLNLPSYGTDFGDPSQADWRAGVMTASDFSFPAVGTFADQERNASAVRATRASTCRSSRASTPGRSTAGSRPRKFASGPSTHSTGSTCSIPRRT